jgi:RNA polymerase sigma-70 factor, ECF subfamily
MTYSTPQTRASLILRLQDAGDVRAWEQFESIYSPVIYRAAIGHGLQPSDAENVIQEVLLRVARSVGKWAERADKGPFRAWLLRIARNETLRLLSRPSTQPVGFGVGSDDFQLEPIAASAELVSKLDIEYQREVFLWAAEQVRGAVAKATWLAFWLTHVEGLSIEEAARRLGVKPGNVYFGRSRVMNRLKLIVRQFEEQQN